MSLVFVELARSPSTQYSKYTVALSAPLSSVRLPFSVAD